MSYNPVDTFSRGPAQVPQLVGERIEAARESANTHGWVLHVNELEPFNSSQPDGLVVAQRPSQGTMLAPGMVVSADVIVRRSIGDRYGRPLLAGVAAALGLVALVFGVLWAGARADADDANSALAESNARIVELQDEVLTAAGDAGEQMAALEDDVAEARAEARRVQTELDAADAQITELTQAAADTELVIAERDALVLERELLVQRIADLEAELGGVTAAVIAMPNFVGTTQVGVIDFSAFNRLELVIQTVDEVDGALVEVGTVMAQLPAPTTPLVPGSAIVVTVFAPSI